MTPRHTAADLAAHDHDRDRDGRESLPPDSSAPLMCLVEEPDYEGDLEAMREREWLDTVTYAEIYGEARR